MQQGLIIDIMNQSLYEVLILSLPLLGTAMVVGLVISIFQATTSIQEQTLTFVPKMIILMVLMIVMGPFFINSIVDFTRRLFDLIATTRF